MIHRFGPEGVHGMKKVLLSFACLLGACGGSPRSNPGAIDAKDCASTVCATHATCSEGPPPRCTCDSGYAGDGLTCADVDECAGKPCAAVGGVCTNSPGSFSCACDGGFYGDGFRCRPSMPQVIWMGHDLFTRNADVDRLVGNAVAQANAMDTIQVVGFAQFADNTPRGEVANTDAAIAARMAELGRTANITHLMDYTALDLTGVHVLLVYEMEMGGDSTAIAAAWAPKLNAFMAGGGVVVVMDFQSSGWDILNRTSLMRFLGASTWHADSPISVDVPADPLMKDVSSPTYTGTNGTASYWTNDGTIVATDGSGIPVVVHKYMGGPRFSGRFDSAWTTLAVNSEENYSLMTYHPAHIAGIYNMYDATGQVYSPATNTWRKLVATGPAANPWFQMAPVGKHLFGFVANQTTVWKYDTVGDTWTNQTRFAGGGTNEYTMAVADDHGRVYGYVSNGNVVVYDPLTNTTTARPTAIPTLRGSGSLYETRVAFDSASHALYLAGYGTAQLYKYDLVTLATTQLTSIPEPQMNDIFCGDRSGHIYAAGGSSGTAMWQYEIATDTWTRLPDYPIDHGNNGACVVSDGGYLYVSGGFPPDLHRLQLF